MTFQSHCTTHALKTSLSKSILIAAALSGFLSNEIVDNSLAGNIEKSGFLKEPLGRQAPSGIFRVLGFVSELNSSGQESKC
jgi:hypothetical protein